MTQAGITVVGLGPGALADVTLDAWRTLTEAEEVWLRTLHHPVVQELPADLSLHSCDAIYEAADTFAEVYAQIAQRILALGQRPQGVVYAVPGHPLVGEATVTQLLALAREAQVRTRVIAGLSFIEPALTALEYDALDGLQLIDALEVLALDYPPLSPDAPALIAQLYSRAVASDLKLILMNQYPDEHPVVLLDAVGTAAQRVRRIPLYEIDRDALSPLSSLYVAPLPTVSSFEGFQQTVARLRSPQGCPWDREQTHASLRMHLLEESYEVLEAIDAGDPDALREELGDLLLQVVLHAQIAGEEGTFQMPQVIAGIDAKLKRRHPHVWGEVVVENAQEVTSNWEEIKREERARKGETASTSLDGIPKALPALAQAQAYSDRAARVGVEREGAPEAQMQADLRALQQAATPDARAQALGSLLFTLADWARRMGIDPESALREANERFAAQLRA